MATDAVLAYLRCVLATTVDLEVLQRRRDRRCGAQQVALAALRERLATLVEMRRGCTWRARRLCGATRIKLTDTAVKELKSGIPCD